MFEFKLRALNQIVPWGKPPNLNLHWFGLTDGSYFVDLGDTHLLEYSAALDVPVHVEYQVARLHEDILEMLPDVLSPVPAGVLRGFTNGSLAATLADLRRMWSESEDEPSEELTAATETLGRRQLDTAYLSPSAGIWFWRSGDQVVVEWDNRGRLFQGVPAWTATVGRHEIPVSIFIEEVSVFHHRLMTAMAGRIDEIAAGWSRPDVKVSLDQLSAEQSQRKPQLDRVLRSAERAQNWQAVEAALSASAGGRGNDGRRAPATANNALRMLKMVLSDGCAEFNLARTPAERVRTIPLRHAPDDDPNILAPEELGRVLDEFRVSEPGDYALALTLALTGLRFGEASALKWDDVREGGGLIRIVRAQWKGHVSTTKTGVIRSVPLVAELAATLRAHRARVVAGQHPGLREGWIFAEEDGSLLRKNYLRRPLERVLARVGIKRRFTVHGFRRTFNNIARQVAGEIVTRSITGHVTQATTEHFSHVGRDEKLAAAGNVVRLVLGARGGAASEGPSGGSGGGSQPDSLSDEIASSS